MEIEELFTPVVQKKKCFKLSKSYVKMLNQLKLTAFSLSGHHHM